MKKATILPKTKCTLPLKLLAASCVLGSVCATTIDVFRPDSRSAEYRAAVALYNAFCPLRCPDEVVLPSSQIELAEYLQDMQARNKTMPITVRGGGHSYTCQSSSSTGAVIDMRRFRQLHIDRRSDGVLEATVGAGLTTGEISSVLDAKGWSMPHGICSTVGVGGYLLNDGNNPCVERPEPAKA